MNTKYDSLTIEKAREIWDYFSSFRQEKSSDAIVLCCSYDLRVCDYACELIQSGFSNLLVISGKTSYWTNQLWSCSEAEVFSKRALDNGVSKDQIYIEDRATNFGENIIFSKAIIPNVETVTFVTKANALLRAKLTAEKQWPEITSYVSSPNFSFPEQVANFVGVVGTIHEMVGDIDRIEKYPSMGFQTPHSLPQAILEAKQYLINQGFRQHLVRD